MVKCASLLYNHVRQNSGRQRNLLDERKLAVSVGLPCPLPQVGLTLFSNYSSKYWAVSISLSESFATSISSSDYIL